MAEPRRVSMWSGPRNISTAMMYSFRSRPDTVVVDEPFYGHYLAHTGADHPGRADVLATQPTRLEDVVGELRRTRGRPVVFFKNMAHHLAGIDMAVLGEFENFLLVRDPADMLVSLDATIDPSLRDTGLPDLVRILDHLIASGSEPIVVRSEAVLDDPERTLRALCRRLDLAWEPAMLAWEPGPKLEDGVWSEHWYASVHATTGFGARRQARPVPSLLEPLLEECRPLYERIVAHALR